MGKVNENEITENYSSKAISLIIESLTEMVFALKIELKIANSKIAEQNSEVEYIVSVVGDEVIDYSKVSYEDAMLLYDEYKAQGYDDVIIEGHFYLKQ